MSKLGKFDSRVDSAEESGLLVTKSWEPVQAEIYCDCVAVQLFCCYILRFGIQIF